VTDGRQTSIGGNVTESHVKHSDSDLGQLSRCSSLRSASDASSTACGRCGLNMLSLNIVPIYFEMTFWAIGYSWKWLIVDILNWCHVAYAWHATRFSDCRRGCMLCRDEFHRATAWKARASPTVKQGPEEGWIIKCHITQTAPTVRSQHATLYFVYCIQRCISDTVQRTRLSLLTKENRCLKAALSALGCSDGHGN